MRKYVISVFSLALIFSCGSPQTTSTEVETNEKSFVGFVELTDPLDEQMVTAGRSIFQEKCASCHTLDTARFFVPSFAGVTNRRKPEWIMNMIMNVDVMVQVDSVAHSLLLETGIKMPEPDLSVDQARNVLEFLRQNDLDQLGEKDAGVNLMQ